MKQFLKYLSIAFAILSLTQCNQGIEPQQEPFIKVTSPTGNYDFGYSASELRVTVNANMKWKLELVFDDNQAEAWCSLYPDNGVDDGRFYIYVDDWDSPYGRSCKLRAIDSDGKELFTTPITQRGTPVQLSIDTHDLSSAAVGGTFTVNVNTNVNWQAQVMAVEAGTDVSWVELTHADMTSQAVTLRQNNTDSKRFAKVRFSQAEDAAVFVELNIVQLPVYSITNAEHIDIAEAVRRYTGLIEDNVKVEGFVTSDYTSGNTPANELYLQDASGRGMCILFADASANTYAINQKLTLWLTGCTFDSDGKLTSTAAANFSEQTTLTGSEATPVDIDDLTTINNYVNTLVRLRNVSFALPVGSLVNNNGDEKACPDYYRIIRDGRGNTATMHTMSTFTQKWNAALTNVDYNITALVIPDKGEIMLDGKRLRHENYTNTLRVRRFADLEALASTTYRPVVLWYETSKPASVKNWVPQLGEGSFAMLEPSVTENVKDATTAREAYCMIDPSLGYSSTNTYYGFSKKVFWSSEIGGLWWEFSFPATSTNGDLYLTVLAGSYGASARYWQVEWSSDQITWNNAGDYELWNSHTTSSSSAKDLSHLYTPQEFSFPLRGAHGASTIYIRLRASENVRVSPTGSTTTIGNTSSSCLLYVGIFEKNN